MSAFSNRERGMGFVSAMKRRSVRTAFFPVIVCGALILARNPDPVFRAEFWAEDATEFFFGALSIGIGSLVTPVYGYHLFTSRVIAYTATFFPVLWAPYIYSVACLLITAFAAAYFSREGFSWIIPSRKFRLFVCVVLAIAPGTAEVYFNLSNLPSVLTVLGLLMLLEKPFRPSPMKFATLLILLPSAGQMLLLAPVVGSLWLLTRERRYLWLLGCMVPWVVLNGIGNHHASGQAGLLSYENAWAVPRVLLENTITRLFFAPIFGDELTGMIIMRRRASVFWLTSLVAVGGAAYAATKWRFLQREGAWLLILSFLCVICSFGLIAVSRNYATYQISRGSGNLFWGHRYSYLPGVVALIIWFRIAHDALAEWRGKMKFWPAAFAVILLAYHNVSQWNAYDHRPDLEWPKGAALIQSALDEKRQGKMDDGRLAIEFPWVHPVGWRPNRGELILRIPPN